MHGQKKNTIAGGNGGGFTKTDIIAPGQSDSSRLNFILAFGFGVAEGYSTLNRDRYFVHLNDGVTPGQLLGFCKKLLGGAPMPRADPISDGPALLRLFKAAEAKGIVAIEFVKAGRFLPEQGTES